jgi:hypothetical protein
MKRLGLILVLIVAAGAVWAAWTCYGTEGTVRDIASRLPSEESLDTMSLEQSTEQIKLAMITAPASQASRPTHLPGCCGPTRSRPLPSGPS